MELGPDPFYVVVVSDLFLAAAGCLLVAGAIFLVTRIPGRGRAKRLPLPAAFRYLLGSGLGLLLTDVIFVLMISVFGTPGAR